MPLPKVTITIADGNLSAAVNTGDGICGIILTGIAVSGKIALLEPKQIFSLKEAEELGLDAEYDTDNDFLVHRQIADFYAQAGTGAELWIMLVADTVTMTQAMDIANDYAKKLLNAASGNIRILAISRTPPVGYTPTFTNGFDDDAFNSIAKAHALQAIFEDNKKPFVVLVSGRAYTGTAGNLIDLHTLDAPKVAVCLVGTGADDKDAAMGLLLGRLASIPVQRNIGRVKDGHLGLTAAYLTNGNTVESQETALDAIHDKGYIVARRLVGKSGYFFSDDPTATPLADSLQGIARNRVINKAIQLAYTYFVEELNSEVPFNADGTLEAGYVKGLQSGMETTINQNMTANEEISNVVCFIDDAQNVLSNNTLNVNIRIQPVGYAKLINITLGFYNPFNS